MNTNLKKCPDCASQNLYITATDSGGSSGPKMLPGLGGFFSFARFRVVVCADCGLSRFYAEPEARAKLPKAKDWQRG